MHNPQVLENPVGQKFRDLVTAWKSDQGVSSSLSRMFAHPAYREIITTGEAAVPWLLAELEREPDWCFAALKAMTGADPVPPAARGRLAEMTRAWLEWGKAQNLRR